MRECSSYTMCHVSCVICHESCVMCHVSCVMCHMSHVTCHMSRVSCQNIFFTLFNKKIYVLFVFFNKFGQSGGASRWRICYQRGLPRLVSFKIGHPSFYSTPNECFKNIICFLSTPAPKKYIPLEVFISIG